MKTLLQRNIGAIDQWLRFALGFLLLFCAGAGLVGPWGYLGIVPLVTAMAGYCPLYHVLGIRTNRHATK